MGLEDYPKYRQVITTAPRLHDGHVSHVNQFPTVFLDFTRLDIHILLKNLRCSISQVPRRGQYNLNYEVQPSASTFAYRLSLPHRLCSTDSPRFAGVKIESF